MGEDQVERHTIPRYGGKVNPPFARHERSRTRMHHMLSSDVPAVGLFFWLVHLYPFLFYCLIHPLFVTLFD